MTGTGCDGGGASGGGFGGGGDGGSASGGFGGGGDGSGIGASEVAKSSSSSLDVPLRFMIDRPPLTLNPRRAGDAIGQRLGALIFRALTRIDEDLVARPDLASGWKVLDGGRAWSFEMRPGAVDHGGEPITAARMAECLEQYRSGKPAALLRGSFPGWLGVEARGASVVLRFEQPSPYLARNASLLRYFRSQGSSAPCSEPAPGASVIASGIYRPETWDLAPEQELRLQPAGPGSRRPVVVSIVPDDNARVLKLMRGEVDMVQNSISLTKERWIEKRLSDRFDFLEREGINVTYLAFNLRDPILGRKEVRRAIVEAIDRASVVRHKLMGLGRVAGSLLSPRLPESAPQEYRYDPAHAEALLDQAGFARKKDGTRFELRYRTNTVREFVETGLMIQDQLSRIGIKVVLDVVEPAVFLASIKKGAYQMYSSVWAGIADGSILHRTLRSGLPDNRVFYADAEMDRVLDRLMSEPEETKRIPLAREAQRLMARDLPYFPLWYMDNTAIVRKGLTGLSAREISLSGAYEPLTRLR